MSGNMASDGIDQVVIVGGGTAGWMTAAALAHKLAAAGVSITLVESEQIGTVGVGEATLPHIRFFNQAMGIDEREMMARTAATFKLGIEFVGWGREEERYIHPFGDYGPPGGTVPFHQLWAAQRADGKAARLCEYSLPVMMAEANRYRMPDTDPHSLLATFGFAYQFDAGLYAAYLSELSQTRGVRRIEGRIVTSQRAPNGDIAAVQLEDGTRLKGDLFIDCSGFRGLLIEQVLETGYEDWSHYLPADRAFAVACVHGEPIGPYTRATARRAGWQWRIPLQHRVGNGIVYCSDYISDDEAAVTLLNNIEGDAAGDPKQLFFKTGKRRRFWNRNVVAIGLSAGFLEPLESTSIHLIQQGITALVELFPQRDTMIADAAEFDAMMNLEYDRVRDFLVLHYVANQRVGDPFWDDRRTMEWPASLKDKVEEFTAGGLLPDYDIGAFLPPSWLAVLVGQNIMPNAASPKVRGEFSGSKNDRNNIEDWRAQISASVAAMPNHEAFVREYCGKARVASSN